MMQEDFQAIAALDLEPIKVKLMHVESGEGWTRAQVDAVEHEYRRFLYLIKRHPEAAAAPSMQVDTFWHYHILDTMAYARDCAAVFGYFLHHFPYIGLRGEADLAQHTAMGQRMQALYEAEFKEPYGARELAAFGQAAGAFSAPALNTAFSAPGVPAAFSAPTVQAAFSAPQVQAAFSAPAVQAAFSAPSQGLNAHPPVAGLPGLFTERPRLAAA